MKKKRKFFNRWKFRKRAYTKSLFLGFSVVYLISMLFSTYVVKRKFEQEFENDLIGKAEQVVEYIEDQRVYAEWDLENINENYKSFMKSALSSIAAGTESKYQQISGAIYDETGNIAARSRNFFGITRIFYVNENGEESCVYPFIDLAEIFTDKELKEFAKMLENFGINDFQSANLPEYIMYAKYDGSTGEILSFRIDQIFWEKVNDDHIGKKDFTAQSQLSWQDAEGTFYKKTGAETVWEKVILEKSEIKDMQEMICYPYEGMPGLKYGIKNWERWMNDQYLQGLPEKLEGGYKGHSYSELVSSETKADITMPIVLSGIYEEPVYTLKMRMKNYPWLAAADYMKYVYFGSLLLMLACLGKVFFMAEKTYHQQEILETTRRDFTNAIAHELKTPLSIIQGFSEILKENIMMEKREYYLEQIIGQTAIMDELVQEMLYISKLDSGTIEWENDVFDVQNVVEEQLKKLEILIKEKNLKIQYDIKDKYMIQGNRKFFEKAIWNLLSNAVEYNILSGKILINIDREYCSIENTGEHIPQEKLSKVFDMFYTGNISRTSGEKHPGIGLYITKRIMENHNLDLRIENTYTGVKVMIRNIK